MHSGGSCCPPSRASRIFGRRTPPKNIPLSGVTRAVSCLGCPAPAATAIILRFWSPFLSEESPNTSICPYGGFITGLACQGHYCDNIAVECSPLVNRRRMAPCYWTEWLSEEGGELFFPAGDYAAGLACRVRYGDNVAFYVCRVE